jgi:hypothetical protein
MNASQRPVSWPSPSGAVRRLDDLPEEHLAGRLDGVDLKPLLGPEVGVDAALAHLQLVGETADRQVAQTLDRGQGHGLLEDGGVRLLTVRPSPSLVCQRVHLDK